MKRRGSRWAKGGGEKKKRKEKRGNRKRGEKNVEKNEK